MSSFPPNDPATPTRQTWQTWQQDKPWSTPATNAAGPTGPWQNPGVNDQLNYIPDTAIHRGYTEYKQKGDAAGLASRAYTKTAERLVAQKPYQDPKPKRAAVGMFHEDGHKTMKPLATDAATAARDHADSRESFNSLYEYILLAKQEFQGHEQQAIQARNSQAKFKNYAKQHSNAIQQYQDERNARNAAAIRNKRDRQLDVVDDAMDRQFQDIQQEALRLIDAADQEVQQLIEKSDQTSVTMSPAKIKARLALRIDPILSQAKQELDKVLKDYQQTVDALVAESEKQIAAL